LNKGDIIDNEYAGLSNGRQIVHDLVGAGSAITPSVKGPGAAEGAVPGTPPGEFDGGAGIEHADEIFAPVPQQVARRMNLVQAGDHTGGRPFSIARDGAGDLCESRPVFFDGR